MRNLKRKNNLAIKILFSILLVAGLALIFQLAKANFTPIISFSGKPQIAYPPPENTPMDFVWPTGTALPSPTVTPTPIVLENGWYLYEDKEAGYSISYPPEVHFHTSKEGFLDYKTVHIAFKPSGLGYQGMVIEIFSNPEKFPVNEIVQKFYSRDNPEIKPAIADIQNALNPTSIGHFSALKSIYKPSMAEFVIFVEIQDKVLCATPVTEMGLTAFAPSSLELFEKILATLTFKP